jgi:hypothetical protein
MYRYSFDLRSALAEVDGAIEAEGHRVDEIGRAMNSRAAGSYDEAQHLVSAGDRVVGKHAGESRRRHPRRPPVCRPGGTRARMRYWFNGLPRLTTR